LALAGLLAWQAVVMHAWAGALQARFRFDATPGLLSKEVVPSHYGLTLDLDPQRDTFGGQAVITLAVGKPMPSLVLHAHELAPVSALLTGAGSPRPLTVTPDPRTQTWRLVPADARPIEAGEHRVHLDYTGKVQTAGEAMFRADHTVDGQPARMLATQLQAVFARQVFPGFDEPAFRAAFDISVRAPKGLTVVSNMPQVERVEQPGADLHRFATTPSMPTYLVAVAVGRFDVLSGEAAGVPLRILSAPGKREHSRYALEVTQQVLPMFTEYFGLPYALPKLDQLAVPSGRNGAMEDWGLISYAEAALLFDPARSGPETRQRVYTLVAHEVAHQWFGNLVTASSWDEIWLNEAFATWMQAKAMARFNPDWQVELQQRLPLDHVMNRDAGRATRAIRSGPVSERSVYDVFDNITYVKGGAVLSMLEQWIGVDAFRRGLAAYIEERKFSNATAGDLWFHLSAASGRDVSAVAASWTDRQGFPVVKLRSRCIDGRTVVTLSQSRFVTRPATSKVDSPAPPWKIPVQLARGAESRTVMLDAARGEFELPGCDDAPVRANAGGEGYYRVAYDDAASDALAREFVGLAGADQVALLSDTFALAQAGQLPMSRYFGLLRSLPRVGGPARATLYPMAGEALDRLDAALAGTPAQARIRAAGRALFAPALEQIGWAAQPGEGPRDEALRGVLVSRLAQWGHEPTVERVRRDFALDESGQAPLPASLRAPVIEAVGAHADRQRFDSLMSRLRSAGSEEERWILLSALSSVRDAGLARELLEVSLKGVVAPNMATQIPGMVAEHSPHGELAYAFTLANWDRLARLAGSQWSGSSWLLPSAASRFNDTSRAERLQADQRRKAGKDGAVPAARIISDIELRAAIRQREAVRLERLLADWRTAP